MDKEDAIMEGIERVCQFLDEAQTYYLATVEGDQPRVRPFGTALLYNGKLYIETGKVKNVSRQIAANPKAEICAFKNGQWLRVAGELVNDDDRDVKVAMLEKMPSLKAMYNPDDGNMQMLYFRNASDSPPLLPAKLPDRLSQEAFCIFPSSCKSFVFLLPFALESCKISLCIGKPTKEVPMCVICLICSLFSRLT